MNGSNVKSILYIIVKHIIKLPTTSYNPTFQAKCFIFKLRGNIRSLIRLSVCGYCNSCNYGKIHIIALFFRTNLQNMTHRNYGGLKLMIIFSKIQILINDTYFSIIVWGTTCSSPFLTINFGK